MAPVQGMNRKSGSISGILYPDEQALTGARDGLLPLKREESTMDKIPLETACEDSAVQFRDCFSVRYILSAALLCRLGYSIEKSCRETLPLPSEPVLRHETFILNSVLSSVAFLESTINELYADAADESCLLLEEDEGSALRLIAKRWKNGKNFDRAPVLYKYQRVLEITERPSFDDREPAYGNVRELVGIRNYLMHYKREWVPVNRGGHPGDRDRTTAEKFEQSLRTKFAPNPFAHRNSPFFPDKCLGHGCAEWAVVNSVVFADEFFRRLGLHPPYDAVREGLATR